MKVIPIQNLPRFQQRVKLSGIEYILNFDYRSLTDRWHLTISTATGTVLVSDVKIVCGMPIGLRQQYKEQLILGSLLAVSSTRDQSPPGRNDLGDRVNLVYFEPGDF